MALTISTVKTHKVKKEDLITILRNYLRDNNAEITDDTELTVALLVDKAGFSSASDETDTISISWSEQSD